MPRSGKSQNNRGQVGVEREDPHALVGLLDRHGDRGQALAQYCDRGDLGIGAILGVGGGHGEELHLAVYPFLFGLLQAHQMVRVLDAFELSHECERVGQADVQVCQTGARDVLAGIVGEIVSECRIERRQDVYLCSAAPYPGLGSTFSRLLRRR